MATSSIFAQFEIKDENTVKRLVDIIEDKSSYKHVVPKAPNSYEEGKNLLKELLSR